MSSKVPEIIACTDKNDLAGVKKCIEKGCNIDEQRQDGRSALLVACIKGYFEIVKVLVENHADIFIKNKKGGNALGHAAYKNHFAIVDYLLQHDADPNSKDNTGRNTLHIACNQGCNDVVKILLESGKINDINDKTKDNRDVLSLAISGNCSIYTIALLMYHGAATNCFDEQKHSLLHQAVLKDNVLLLDFLYQHTNINLNLIDMIGNTCVHLATSIGSRRCLTYLVSQGAIVNSRNKEGRLPEAVAIAHENEEMVDFLHTLTGPPPVVTSLSTYKGKKSSECVVCWEYPKQPSYLARIESVEIQVKSNKLFDSWKTVGTARGSERAATDADHVLQLDEISFDRKCGSIGSYSEEVLQFMKEHEDHFEKRKVNPKQWNVPEPEMIIKDIQGSNNVIKIRLANKYKLGEYSESFPVEMKRRHSKKQEKKKKESSDSEVEPSPIEEAKTPREVKKEPVNADEVLRQIVQGGTDALLQQIAAGVDIASLHTNEGFTLIHLAAQANNIKLVDYLLLSKMLSVNQCTDKQLTPLHLAPSVEMVTFLLDHGADLTLCDQNGMTPFLTACTRGDMEIVHQYISRMDTAQRNVTDKQQRNAIMLAINANQDAVVSLLVKNGVDIEYAVPPPQCWNALFYAISKQNKPIAEFCMECGISPSLRNKNGVSPLDYCQEQGYFELTQLLNNYTSVPEAVQDIDVVVEDDEALVSIQLPNESKTGPIFEFQEVEVSYKKNAFLAQSKQILVNLKQSVPENSIVKVRLEDLAPSTVYQCRVRVSNRNGFGSWSKAVEIRLDDSEPPTSESEEETSPVKTSTPETPESESESDSPIIVEAEKVEEEPSKSIEDKAKAIEIEAKPVEIPTESTLVEMESTPTIRIPTPEEILGLVQTANLEELAKVDPNLLPSIHTESQLSLVHTAILSKHSGKKIREMLKILADAKCSLTEEVDTTYYSALSPVLCACLLEESTVLDYLLHNGGKIPTSRICGVSTAIFFSLLAPSSSVLEYLLSRESSIPQGDKGRSLLHILATMNKNGGNEEMVLALLAKGIAINGQDEDGNTPLHLCSLYSNTNLIPLLIVKGASLTIPNQKGETPLDVAVNLNNALVVDAFSTVLEVPLPPGTPEVHSCLNGCLEIRWSEPMRRDCVPDTLYYEVEGIHPADGTVFQLASNHSSTSFITSISVPLTTQIHIRAKNVNGWSQWSNFGCIMPSGKEWDHELYVWLYHHSMERYYERVVEYGITSVEELMRLSSSDIGKLKFKPIHEKMVMNLILYSKNKPAETTGSTKENRSSWFRK